MKITITVNLPMVPMVIMGSTFWAGTRAIYQTTQDVRLALALAALMVAGQSVIALYCLSKR